MIPKLALVYLPLMLSTLGQQWPAMHAPAVLAAQVEQETCASLTSPKCWNPRAELKTSREYGFGFGQITRAYRADGTTRFDKFSELTEAHADLKGWVWEQRYDPAFQMRALIDMDLGIYKRMNGATPNDKLAFTMSAYNCGEGCVRQSQLLCRNTAGCNPAVWFGNVEKTSMLSKQKWQGYGQAAHDINRGYVHNVFNVRPAKYLTIIKG